MGLVDMKSNLAAGAGKPLGSPDGRHEGKDNNLGKAGSPTGRHDPDPDLKTSNLDFGPPNEKITNPGGRHLDSPIWTPSLIAVPDKKQSKIQVAIAKAKTAGMSYIMQKVKGLPNPAKKYLSDEKWGGFLESFRQTEKWESEGILGLDSRYDRGTTGDYMSNFFTYQSPKGEIWPASTANVGGKLLPQVLLSAAAFQSNLFIVDYFHNDHAYGFTKHMSGIGPDGSGMGTRYRGVSKHSTGVEINAKYEPQNERNKMLAGLGQTVSFVSNIVNNVGFIKKFTGKMFNSPSTSNFAGIDDASRTYTPPEGALQWSSPDYHSKENPYIAGTDPSYSKQFFVNTSGFKTEFINPKQSQYKGLTFPDQWKVPKEIHSLHMLKRDKKFLGGPKDGWKYHGFKDSRENEDHSGFTSGKNVHHSSAKYYKEPAGVWGDLVNLWGGTSLWQDSNQDNRKSALLESRDLLNQFTTDIRNTAGFLGTDAGVVRGITILDDDNKPQFVQSRVDRLDQDRHSRGNNPFNSDNVTLPKTGTIVPNSVLAIESPQADGRLFQIWDIEKSGIYGAGKIVRTDQWFGDSPLTYIDITGEPSQEKWDPIGERFLSGPTAMIRAGERFVQFTNSPQFILFEGKQFALQALNATAETRVYNPLSISSAFSSLARIKRHAGQTYSGVLGNEKAPKKGKGRVEFQSKYQKGSVNPARKVDMKKVDPNRYAGAFGGANQLKLLGSQALVRAGLSNDELQYTQDVTITKNGFKYQNVLTPKTPYFDQQRIKDINEETLQNGTGMPRYVVNPINRKLTFKRNGKKEKNKSKSAIETIYKKMQSRPSQVSDGHSGYGSKKPGAPSEKAIQPSNKAKDFSTLNTIKKSFKPKNDGAPGMPEGGYEKEGLFKGVKTTLQPGKYKINQRVDGGRGFASAASPGTRKKDHYASGKKDARGNKTRDEINVIPYGKPNKTPWENKDFVPFKFHDVYNKKQLVFRSSFKSLTETITPEWNNMNYLGRPDQLHVYKGATRDLNMNFIIYPYSYVEFKILWAKLNYFAGLAMPSYEKIKGGGERMVPPFIELTIGDMYKKTPGFIKTMNITYDMDATWEIKTGERLPKKIDVTCDFTYIGKEQWKRDGNHYGFDAKKFNRKAKG